MKTYETCGDCGKPLTVQEFCASERYVFVGCDSEEDHEGYRIDCLSDEAIDALKSAENFYMTLPCESHAREYMYGEGNYYTEIPFQ